MRAGIGLVVAALACLVGTGCCRMCHWCDDPCCRSETPRPRCSCDPPPRANYPDCECPPDNRLPPAAPSRYEGDPARTNAPQPDNRPTGDPRYDRRPVGAYGGSGQ